MTESRKMVVAARAFARERHDPYRKADKPIKFNVDETEWLIPEQHILAVIDDLRDWEIFEEDEKEKRIKAVN